MLDFYIIPNIDDTFYAKMLKYKIKYKYNIYINKYIIKYKHKLNTRARSRESKSSIN